MTDPAPLPPPPTATTSASTPAPFPKAVVVSSTVPAAVSKLWWLTGLCLIIAIVLVIGSQRRHGPTITIHFANGHGVKAGDTLQYRGIIAGEVTDVTLQPDLKGVRVTVVLEAQSASLARKGSEFWVERPRISLARVSGLETIVGAKYLGVHPGPTDAPPAHRFDGIESPPTLPDAEFSEIMIRFAEGHGLQVGDSVRHRGIVIGEVIAIDLEQDLAGVSVRVRLAGAGRQAAREGSQFWVEHARVSVAEVRGLDTLIGGRYVAVMPGPVDAELVASFVGLETAPVEAIPPGGIEIILHAPQRWGIDRGVPVTYRGLRVGQVTSVGLASDGSRIEARASIEARYRSLVRRNSVFWSTSGIGVNLGLTGLQLTADTLSTIAQGGIAFATPETPGEAVSSGQRFAYERVAQEEWTTWRPRINLLAASRSVDGPVPEPIRAIVRWTEKSFGFNRKFERSGWVMILDNQMILGPAEILAPTEHPIDGVVLETAGVQLKLDPKEVIRNGLLATAPMAAPVSEGIPVWPKARVRNPVEPEDILIYGDPQAAPHPLAASSLKAQFDGWEPESTSGLSPTWHGAPVAAAKDGALIGQLIFRRNKPIIVPLQLK